MHAYLVADNNNNNKNINNNNNKKNVIQKIKLDFTHSVNLGPIFVDIIMKKKN